VTPQLVKATVVVKKAEVQAEQVQEDQEKTISSVPLKIEGLGENLTAEVSDPTNQTINLVVNGPSDTVTGLAPDDFSAVIDLSGLTEGTHDVKIQVTGPTDVKWTPNQSTAKITITNNA
jgi:YbbR domain-containing protein